jgi:cobalamin-dependent methionine synthase I
MVERLEPGRNGVELSADQQLRPGQSTDAFVL